MYRKKFHVVPRYPLPPQKQNKTNKQKNTFRIKVVTIWCISFQRFFFMYSPITCLSATCRF